MSEELILEKITSYFRTKTIAGKPMKAYLYGSMWIDEKEGILIISRKIKSFGINPVLELINYVVEIYEGSSVKPFFSISLEIGLNSNKNELANEIYMKYLYRELVI